MTDPVSPVIANSSDHRSTDVEVKKSNGPDDDSKSPHAGDEGTNGELNQLARLLDAPLISCVESILYRSRFDGRRSRRACLSDFRKNRPRAFKCLCFVDVFFARGTFVVIALIVLTRVLDVHPIQATVSSIQTVLELWYSCR